MGVPCDDDDVSVFITICVLYVITLSSMLHKPQQNVLQFPEENILVLQFLFPEENILLPFAAHM